MDDFGITLGQKKAIEKRKKLPPQKKRIGWIKDDPNYVPCFFGNSCADWLTHIVILIIIYAVAIALGILILILTTLDCDLTLGLFGVLGIVFFFGVSVFVYEGQKFYKIKRLSGQYIEEYFFL